MRIPCTPSPTAVKELNEPHATLDQFAGDKALLAERLCLRFIDAVHRFRRDGFLFKIDYARHGYLHLEGEFVGLYARAQLLVVGIVDSGERIQLSEQTEVLQLLLGSHPRIARTK